MKHLANYAAGRALTYHEVEQLEARVLKWKSRDYPSRKCSRIAKERPLLDEVNHHDFGDQYDDSNHQPRTVLLGLGGIALPLPRLQTLRI